MQSTETKRKIKRKILDLLEKWCSLHPKGAHEAQGLALKPKDAILYD